MSESAEDKTKRRFVSYLDSKDWVRQTSFWFTSLEYVKREEFFTHSHNLRESLAKSYPSCSFLWRLAAKRIDSADIFTWQDQPYIGPMPFWTVFQTEVLPFQKVEGKACKVFKLELNSDQMADPCVYARTKKANPEMLSRYRSTILSQRPHNLKNIFGDKKINRFHKRNWGE